MAAVHGQEMRDALHLLADNFDAIAVPKHGRYVDHPVTPDQHILDDANKV